MWAFIIIYIYINYIIYIIISIQNIIYIIHIYIENELLDYVKKCSKERIIRGFSHGKIKDNRNLRRL